MKGFWTRSITAVFMAGILSAAALPAFAGFEWVPPSEITLSPPQAEELAPVDISRPMMPILPPAQQGGMGGIAPAPVTSEPLSAQGSAQNQPITLHRKRPSTRARGVRAALKASAKSGSGLVIDPYPAQDGFSGSPGEALMGVGPVEQAMMEESRSLNPVPLGMGYSTGVKLSSAGPSRSRHKISRASKPVNLLDNSAMTPLLGESAAPMQNFEQAPTQISSSFPSSENSINFDQAVGFGQDLPLALALSQVIPVDYALAFGTTVNAGTNVSWEGGKPWNEVLDDMLRPLGLRADIQFNRVMVRGA